MFTEALTTLKARLSPHLPLSNSRLETMCFLILGMVNARTVNLSHLACEFPTYAKVGSTYRRLQRFFQHVELGSDWAAPLIVKMIGAGPSWHLCLDRTNWKIGQRHINFLVLALVTRRHRIPLMWSVLGRAGNSDTAQRITLMQRYLSVFEVSTIKFLLADREFIGVHWLDFLHKNNIPFVIRVKANQIVTARDGKTQSLITLLRTCRGKRNFDACFGGNKTGDATWFSFAGKRIKGGELLIVVSNRPAHHALTTYKKRWAIENLFGDTKTRGFNIEDTRLTISKKLELLLGLVALAVAWASKTATKLIGIGKMKGKNHGYFAKSFFRIGFDQIRKLLKSDPIAAVSPWLLIPTKIKRVV
jgi:uncharacterized membrane protein